ncbi:MAG TPA: PorT family protein [Flavobacteriales bacterium]|nr:PorT family protein [Flavobacteriales bacterium]HIN38950.1 PorT family protein [Flavobacteriales bacterium]
MKLAHKKIFTFLILATLILGTTMVKAQDKKFGFGIHATPALTWMQPDDEKVITRDGTKTGLGYGLMFDLRFGENYSLSTGLNLISSSARLKYLDPDTMGILFTHDDKTDTLSAFTATYKLNYIEVPIHLLLKTNEIGYMKYFGQFGFLLQGMTKAKADATVKDISNEDVSKEIKFANVALSIGAGFEYSLGGNTALIVALIYNNGFLNILEKDKDPGPIEGAPEYMATSKSIALKLGIMF